MDETAGVDSGAPPPATPGHVAKPNWAAFTLICLAYFVTTTGEQMLSPLFPVVADDLGLSVTQGGIAFAVLTGTIAATNLVGGAAMRRWAPAVLVRAASVTGAAGAIVNALSPGYAALLVGPSAGACRSGSPPRSSPPPA
jgi:DHA1 family inner membrane transport protein